METRKKWLKTGADGETEPSNATSRRVALPTKKAANVRLADGRATASATTMEADGSQSVELEIDSMSHRDSIGCTCKDCNKIITTGSDLQNLHTKMKRLTELVPMGDSLDKTEQVLKAHLQEWQESYNAGIQAWLPRLRKCTRDSSPKVADTGDAARHTSLTSRFRTRTQENPFAGMSAVTEDPTSTTSTTFQRLAITSATNQNKGVSRSSQAFRVTTYQDTTVHVPPYTYHVQINSNVLTENNAKLNYNPMVIEYGDQDWSVDEYERQINEVYAHGVPWDEERDETIEDVEHAKQLRPSVLKALQELGCSVADVQRYLLDPTPPSARKKEARRGLQLKREWGRWAAVLSALPESTDQAQALAADVCEAFENLIEFSIWHVIKDEKAATVANEEAKEENKPEANNSYNSLMCRVCFSHLCTAHGEFEEEYEKAAEKGSRIEQEPGGINYRLGITCTSRRNTFPDDVVPSRTLEPRQPFQHWLKTLHLYRQAKSEGILANSLRGQFYPCSHEGPCDRAAMCSCYINGVNCEKTCECSIPCERRFTGCNCARIGTVCGRNQNCACLLMERECDPDLCFKCGAAEVLDPNKRTNGTATKKLCANVSIQLGVAKRMLLGRSLVAGFGLFTGEDVKQGEFLGEYKGELLSEPEADRRQILRQHLREYLFVMNKDQQVDSTLAGNKIRFVNNSCKPENINCYPAPLLCNGVMRMGLFARRDLKAGEEVFFQYGYTDEQMAKFKEAVQTVASKTAGSAAEKLEQKKRGRLRRDRQSMNVTSARPREFTAGTGRVIDDSESEASSAHEDEEDQELVEEHVEDGRLELVDMRLDDDYEGTAEEDEDGDEGKDQSDDSYEGDTAEPLYILRSNTRFARSRPQRATKRRRLRRQEDT